MSKKNVNSVYKFLEFFERAGQELSHDDISLYQLKVFFYVAHRDLRGESVEGKQIAEDLGLSTSGVSRTIASLGEHGRGARKGLRLLETEVDTNDRRKKYVHLSRKGHKAIEKLTGA